MKVSKLGLTLVALAISSSIEAKGLLDVLIDKAVDKVSEVVNQNTSQVNSESSESLGQDLPNGYISATPNDAGEVGSLNPDVIEDGVTSIGNYAFEKCSNLESIEIIGKVTGIGNSAFYGCTSLKNVEIPDSVTKIDSKAFFKCRRDFEH